MNIQAVSGAATIAVVCALIFFFAAKSWYILSRVLSGHPDFADSIMCEAAQRFRDEVQRLRYKQSSYLGAGLVFVVIYLATTIFPTPKLFDGYPEWQLLPLLAALVAMALYALYRLSRYALDWRQMRFLRDANIAVGHQLQQIASDNDRVFHDIPTIKGIIDHVTIGQNGVYAVNVVARRRPRRGSVCLENKALMFSNAPGSHSIADIIATTNGLSEEFRKLIGRGIRVRSVIAVPGWDIQDQTSKEYLLVNERTLPMLRGWKDQGDYLMNEDVTAIQDCLTARCTRSKH